MENYDQTGFLKKIEELKDTAFLCGGMVTDAQIDEIFPGLDSDKRKQIEEYLKQQHIGINEAIDPEDYMTEEDINLLDIYMESLGEVSRLNDSKKRVMMMDALNGDKSAKEALINHYLSDVVDTARLYTGQGVNIMDLIGEGNVALALSMNSLECVEGPDDVEPLVMRMIMNAMEECIGTESDNTNVDEKVLDLVNKIQENAKELADELLRKVTIEELSKKSGISEKRIKEVMIISKELNDLIDAGPTEK